MKQDYDKNLHGMTEIIVDFCCAPMNHNHGGNARHIARISLFDWLAVAMAGKNEPISQIIRQFADDEGGANHATGIGMADRLPARLAALVNGTVGHALDYDDTHFTYLGHPSAVVFPATLAIAQKIGCDFDTFLDASLIGMETAIRIGHWLGHGHHTIGFHPTATAGTFGATTAVARLLKLTPEQTGYALGLAATRASGLRAQFGTMAKPYHAGMTAANGVEVALLAQAGCTSQHDALESEHGFAVTHHGAMGGDITPSIDGLGQTWWFESVLHKFHACCHGTHATLEALMEVRDTMDIDPENIAHITITVPPRYLKVCNIINPKNGLEAKFSYALCTALVLYGRDTASLDTYCDTVCTDPQLIPLQHKVSVEGSDSLAETEAKVSISTIDGQTFHATHDISTPINTNVREQKVRAKGTALLGHNSAETLWDAINQPTMNKLENWLNQHNSD